MNEWRKQDKLASSSNSKDKDSSSNSKKKDSSSKKVSSKDKGSSKDDGSSKDNSRSKGTSSKDNNNNNKGRSSSSSSSKKKDSSKDDSSSKDNSSSKDTETPVVSMPHVRPSSPTNSVGTDGDLFVYLATFDTVFLIDDSRSMRRKELHASASRWNQAGQCIAEIAQIAADRDDDGVDVFFINHESGRPGNDETGKAAGGYLGLRNGGAVREVFSNVVPRGATQTGERLNFILDPYLKHLERRHKDEKDVKPLNLIVITDGAATDREVVKSVIRKAIDKLDQLEAVSHQLGIQFFQVGTSRTAAAFLMELDNKLSDTRDIVDTVHFQLNADGVAEFSTDVMLKTLLGGVQRKWDRKKA